MGLPISENTISTIATDSHLDPGGAVGMTFAPDNLVQPRRLSENLTPVLPSIGVLFAVVIAAFFPRVAYSNYSVTIGSLISILFAVRSLFGAGGFAWRREPFVSTAMSVALTLTMAAIVASFFSHSFDLVSSRQIMHCAAFFSGVALWQRFHAFTTVELGAVTTGLPPGLSSAAWKKPGLDAREIKVAPETLKTGELCLCRKGDVVPCDGSIVRGALVLHERLYSGILQLRIRCAGESVSACSQVLAGEAVIRIVSEKRDSRVNSFVELISGPRVENASEAGFVFASTANFTVLAALFAGVCEALILRELHLSWYVTLNAAAAVIACVTFLDLIPLLPSIGILAIRAGFLRGVLFRSVPALSRLAQCKDFIVDYSSAKCPFEEIIRDFVIFDERIDRAALESALLAIFSKDETAAAFEQALTVQLHTLTPHRVGAVQHFRGGLVAQIESSEFSIGNEEFLIARGVKLQLSELANNEYGVETVYVAIEDAVVARFFLAVPNLTAFQKSLARLGFRVRLWGSNAPDLADSFGKKCGLELAQIAGGLTTEQYITKIQDARRCALLLSDGSRQPVIAAAHCTLSEFDAVRWDIERSDVILFGQQASTVCNAVSIACLYRFVNICLWSWVAATVGVGLLLTICGVLSPAAVITATISANLAGWFFCDYAFLKSWRFEPAVRD